MKKAAGSTTMNVILAVLAVGGLAAGLAGLGIATQSGRDTLRAVQSMDRRMRELEMRLAQGGRRGAPGGGPMAMRQPMPGDGPGAAELKAGLESAIATGQNLNPEVVSRMYDNYVRMENLAARQKEMIRRNREQHQADYQKYGKEVLDLFAKSRPANKDDAAARKESDEAFNTLLSKYPEANSTAMAIAERALTAALDQSSTEALQYYNQLKSSDAYAHVVTDNGVEAVPALQSYLVQDYLSKGQIAEARAIIADMKQNYSDSVILDRTPDSMEPTWRTVSEVAANLERLIDAGGGAPPPGGPQAPTSNP